jgi:tyrosine-protein phosphatase YwqE
MFSALSKLFNTQRGTQEYYKVDLHSHLIPAIDDGSQSMQESIELIKELKKLGYKKLITTPHIMHHRFPNSSETILAGLEDVKAELKAQNIEIELEVAAEYYLDEYFLELLNAKDILSFGENYLLFEMSYAQKPLNLESVIHEIKVAGYKPVLAHPERYLFMHRDFSIYERLKEQGVLFQVNLNSFNGYYSKPVQKVVLKILENGWVDFIGSDTHKAKQLEYLAKNLDSKLMSKIFEKSEILNDTLL